MTVQLRNPLFDRPKNGASRQSDSHERGADISDYRRGIWDRLGAHDLTNDSTLHRLESKIPRATASLTASALEGEESFTCRGSQRRAELADLEGLGISDAGPPLGAIAGG